MALAVLMLAALSEVQSAAACRDCLQAGAASAALRVPPGTSLAGYGSAARRLMFPDLFARYEHAFWFKPHTGDLDKLMTRVLVLERGTARLLWVALDVVAVDRAFTGALAQRLGLAAASNTTLIVSASHTHSGPGAFIDSAVMGFLAVDRLDRTVRDALLESVVGVVRRASAGSRPARIGVASVTPPAVTTGRLGRAVDPEMIVVKFTTLGGSPIALLWNYAIHGTALGPRNLHLSSDVMGMASTLAEEALSVPVLFVNGAVADVSPRRHGRDGALASARELAESLRKAWHEAEAHRRAVIEVRTKTVRLGAPHLSLRNCVGGWVPRRLPLPLGSTFPQDAELIGVNLGPVVSVSVPGELQSVLGGVVKRAASEHWRHAFIAGLSNDYLGYFVTAADYDRPSYVACANLYGRRAGDEIARVAAQLVGDLAADHPRLSKRP